MTEEPPAATTRQKKTGKARKTARKPASKGAKKTAPKTAPSKTAQGVLQQRQVLRRHSGLQRRHLLRRQGDFRRRYGPSPRRASHRRRHSPSCDVSLPAGWLNPSPQHRGSVVGRLRPLPLWSGSSSSASAPDARPSRSHAGDCHAAGNRRRPVDRDEARRLLASGLASCPHCHPDIELHILD
ncbi:DUF6233 domain-containing protein [Streptomyces africanus]|uniref:DUF6233 domain-containing protein n=1 Tax=Streptomyces africanus TaxID=231024 RepID=UPI0027D8D7CC|nr:DUF6233 domain-containing protein [Streptomyces africanus]